MPEEWVLCMINIVLWRGTSLYGGMIYSLTFLGFQLMLFGQFEKWSKLGKNGDLKILDPEEHFQVPSYWGTLWSISGIFSEFVKIQDILIWTSSSNCTKMICSHVFVFEINNILLILSTIIWGTFKNPFKDPRNIEHFFGKHSECPLTKCPLTHCPRYILSSVCGTVCNSIKMYGN